MMRTHLIAAVALCLVTGCKANDKYLCKSRQAEAKTSLGSLLVAQKSYFAENNKYASSMTDLKLTTEARYYDLKIESATATSFSATATGKNEAAGDVWSVSESSTTATAKVDKCAQ